MSDESDSQSVDYSPVETENVEDPFTVQGKFKDEVTLLFSDDRQLYVPQLLLTMSSPVFEVMFNSNFKEKDEMKVNLSRKCYEDFLEFLLCIHPGILKSIDTSNVLRVAPIVEEYQVQSLIKACKSYMIQWLDETLQNTLKDSSWSNQLGHLKHILDIMNVASELNYDNIFEHGAKLLSKFPHGFYETFTPDVPSNDRYNNWSKVKNAVTACTEVFSRLPIEKRYHVLCLRLALFNQTDFRP